MRFKLNIDKTKDELVEATLHGKGDFSYRLEELVLGYTGEDRITAYTEDDIKILKFSEIECITVDGSKTVAIDNCQNQQVLACEQDEDRRILGGFFRFGRRDFQVRLQGLCVEKMLCGYQEGVEVR